jgi:predicted PurR-regulated permease PerM
MVPTRTARAVFVLLAVLAVALLLAIALPFATPLFVAAVLAGAFEPWVDHLGAFLGGRRKIAAAVVTLAVLLAVVGPLSGLGAVIVPQIVSGVAWLRSALNSEGVDGLVGRVPSSLRPLAEQIQHAIPGSLDRLQQLATVEGGRAAGFLGTALSATGSFVLRSVLMLIALYFLLVDGRALVGWLNDAVPLKRGQVSELLRDFRRVTVTVLVSTLLTAAVQAVLALVGYVIARVPSPIFFTLATFLLALVPVLGATVVVLAVAAVMTGLGHVASGIFLAVWGLAVVGMVDNVVKPLFIRGGVPIHAAVVFFALFGGLAAFGPVGFLVGPLAVTFLVAVVRMYRRDYASGRSASRGRR